ncbi:Major centromere autoantigen B [Dictyocoela muelleri]|nr:Major centromere autoantigen B [Dictyocoela muelleri]
MKNTSNKKLDLKEKIELIEYKENFPTTPDTRIAEIFSMKFSKPIGRRSIKYFWDNKEAITSTYVSNNNLSTIPRRFKFPELDALSRDWVDRIEGQGGFPTHILLKTKALSIYKEMSNDGNKQIKNEDGDFKASNGMLYKFKSRHNISLKHCSGDNYEVNRQYIVHLNKILKRKFFNMNKITSLIATKQLSFLS